MTVSTDDLRHAYTLAVSEDAVATAGALLRLVAESERMDAHHRAVGDAMRTRIVRVEGCDCSGPHECDPSGLPVERRCREVKS